jgi:hypothetical protein
MNKKQKHTYTPGSWIASHDYDKNFVEPAKETKHGDYIAYVPAGRDIGLEEANANARLMAAALDMLEACEFVIHQLSNIADDKWATKGTKLESIMASVKRCEAATKKVRGEQ